jgi:hypothetical protein
MAQRVFLHVGLPKTGTTYVQTVLWRNRAALAEQGLLYPGPRRREHMWASMVVREHPGLPRRNPRAQGAWARLLEQVAAAPDDVLISHEFFGAASAEQAKRALSDLGDVEVHLLVTARDLVSVVTSYWQEYIKHGFDAPLDTFPPHEDRGDEWTWAAVDLLGVLERWGSSLPPERIHLLVLPEPSAPRETLVTRFAGLMGVDATGFDFEGANPNSSLGVVEVELLRRIVPRLDGFTSALDRGVWIRSYLSHDVLVPHGGESFLPSAARLAELTDRANSTVETIRGAGYDVVGDLDRLRVGPLGEVRHPDDVRAPELLAAALDTIATMMGDLREIRRENTAMRQELKAPPPPPPTRWERVLRRLRLTSAAR